jgi:hypothetical protein
VAAARVRGRGRGSARCALAGDIACRSWEALAVCVGLLQLPPELLPDALPHVTPAVAREEVLRILIESAVAPGATPYFAVRAIECAAYVVAAEELMVIVANRAFLVRPNFGCVFVVFRWFLQRVARKNGGEILEFCEALMNEETAVFADEVRRIAFANVDAMESLAAALNEYVVE